MAMSVEELDTTVRTFYDGRGEAVCPSQSACTRIYLLIYRRLQQKQAQATMNQVYRDIIRTGSSSDSSAQ